MKVSIEQAYGEACKALGESIVIQRLQAAQLEHFENQAERREHLPPLKTEQYSDSASETDFFKPS